MRRRVLVVAVAAMVGGVGLMQLGGSAAEAQTPSPGLNLWIAVEGVPGCSTQSGNATCDITPGSTFVVDVHIDPLPTNLPKYDGFDIKLSYAGVTPNHDANMDAWPDCGFPAATYNEPPRLETAVLFGCAIGLPPAQPSTYVGLIGNNSFVCTQSGSIELAKGESGTDVVDDNIQPYAEPPGTTDKLTINCVQGGDVPPPFTPRPGVTTEAPVTPLEPTAAAIATSTAQQQATATAKAIATAGKTPGTSGENDGGSGGLSGGVIAIIIVAGVAAAGAAGVAGWRVMQSRGSGGAPPA